MATTHNPSHAQISGVPPSERLLTAAEVAQFLAVPLSWVREATRAERLPHLKLGRYRRYQLSAIGVWLETQHAGPIATLPPAKPPNLHQHLESSL
jgi:excisionase family DNA binding protein